MGMPPFFSADSADTGIIQDYNPSPKNFKIIKCVELYGWTISLIQYPDCNTYSGAKLCVYACGEAAVRMQTALDPHFGEGGGLYPVARFEPSYRGIKAAVAMIVSMRKE